MSYECSLRESVHEETGGGGGRVDLGHRSDSSAQSS